MERIFKGRVVVPGAVHALTALVSHGGFNTLASFQMACKSKAKTPVRRSEQPGPVRQAHEWAWPSACPRP